MITLVALDLETTGLDPTTDTIIEIAAVRFEIAEHDGRFEAIHTDLRSMLINPGLSLPEEVTLITGITDSMLTAKPMWEDVRDRVRDFIGTESIIVGHNVFFDIDMLAHHGIDLTDHTIWDTFEFAEIFAQDAQSMNLGFLGDFYHIPKHGTEHRALTDVWMSIDLMMIFLDRIANLDVCESWIWRTLGSLIGVPWIASLPIPSEIGIETDYTNWKNSFAIDAPQAIEKYTGVDVQEGNFSHISLAGNPDEEKKFLLETIKNHEKIQIIVHNQKIARYLAELMDDTDVFLDLDAKSWIAPIAFFEGIDRTIRDGAPRKKIIFLLKLVHWLSETETGLLQELKWYGDEYAWIEFLRTREDESHIFREKYERDHADARVIIRDIFSRSLNNRVFSLYRDIIEVENTIRMRDSEKLDLEQIRSDIEHFPHVSSTDAIMNLVNWIESIYDHIADRPRGEHAEPPGKYGETYTFSQAEIWERGCKWLALTNYEMSSQIDEWQREIAPMMIDRESEIRLTRTTRALRALFSYHMYRDENRYAIVTILAGRISIRLLDRNIISKKSFFRNGIGYGYGIDNVSSEAFLNREIVPGTMTSFLPKNPEKHTRVLSQKDLELRGKTLILTTNMRHIRELGEYYASYRPILQGTSGGKAKMQHYFLEGDADRVLIGLIDTWRDEFSLLAHVDQIVIARVPFDPPTDPYFLVKTHKMSRSFDQYTKPIVLARLNTLIGNYLCARPDGIVYCSDDRIRTTEWGRFLVENMI